LVSERSGIEDLGQLRAEIATLVDLPALSPQFSAWLRKLYEVVEANFGVQSDEMRQLRAISPELPSEFYDSVATRLESLGLNEKLTNALLLALNKDGPEKVFKQRLHDYEELITTMIHGLQSSR
jgi:hypothetical protein